jgi:hypothetical protein
MRRDRQSKQATKEIAGACQLYVVPRAFVLIGAGVQVKKNYLHHLQSE